MELTTGQVLISIVLIALAVVGLIWFFKRRMAGYKPEELYEKHKDKAWESPLLARTKYPEVNTNLLSAPFFKVGLIASLLFSLVSFNWTTYEKQIDYSQYSLDVDEEVIAAPPRTAEAPPPPPPPPAPPVIKEVPDELVDDTEQPELQDMTVDAETVTEVAPPAPKTQAAPPPPPPPPPPKEEKVEEIFKVVEQMPLFGGCKDKECSEKELITYLAKNLKYPTIARENGIEGRVIVQFVVEKDGKVSDIKIARDIGGGCGEESYRVIESMNDNKGKKSWEPGKQRGKAVRVYYTLPVTFKLQ